MDEACPTCGRSENVSQMSMARMKKEILRIVGYAGQSWETVGNLNRDELRAIFLYLAKLEQKNEKSPDR